MCAAAVVVALAGGGGSVAAAAAPVAVYPTAGTSVASPQTQISFRGVSSGQLGQLTVTGSRTDAHGGSLQNHSDGHGASFIPSQPFAAGEAVTVRASGVSLVGEKDGAVTFKVGTFPTEEPEYIGDPGGIPADSERFRTIPNSAAPRLTVVTQKAGAAPGYVFVGPKAGPGPQGPMIYDGNGKLIWYHPINPRQSAFDFRVQQYDGKPVLTWWQGKVIQPGEGLGLGAIYDSSYTRIALVRMGNGYTSDLHEFQLTPQGTALMLAYQPVRWNLSGIGGESRGVAIDNVVQEVDIKTGLVEREWHALGRVSLARSRPRPESGVPFDAFHV